MVVSREEDDPDISYEPIPPPKWKPKTEPKLKAEPRVEVKTEGTKIKSERPIKKMKGSTKVIHIVRLNFTTNILL